MIHDFQEQLAWSEQSSEEPFWEAVYRSVFPNMVNHMSVNRDCQAQRQGIDRVILLENGVRLNVDEKKRRGTWQDFALEYQHVSDDGTRRPGWIEKDFHIDFLSYAFMPTREVFVFPWLLLRRVWRHFGPGWKTNLRIIRARNSNYTTLSVPVPREELLSLIARSLFVQLDNNLLPLRRPA